MEFKTLPVAYHLHARRKAAGMKAAMLTLTPYNGMRANQSLMQAHMHALSHLDAFKDQHGLVRQDDTIELNQVGAAVELLQLDRHLRQHIMREGVCKTHNTLQNTVHTRVHPHPRLCMDI